MATVEPRRTASSGQAPVNGHDGGYRDWASRTRIFLTPVAAPSILGLFGLASSTFMVAAYLAGWYGQSQGTNAVLSNLAPFVLTFGGIGQFLAGMWCYRARDGIGTAMHGMWGAFWIAFGIFFILVGAGALHVVTSGAAGKEMVPYSYWFYTLAVITACGAFAALFKNAGLTGVLTALAIGSALVAIGFSSGVTIWLRVGGYALVVSAALAVYTALALMLEGASGRIVLPLGLFPYNRREHWLPGLQLTRPRS
jgi:succinate-acetate transporter protein